MDIKKTPRTDARHASIVRQGLEWALTYGQRSAAAFLLVRKVPRPVVERIPISMDGRGRALVVVRQSRRRWEDAYTGDTLVTDASDRAIISRGTSASALLALFDDGVNLYSVADLHAKVYVFDAAVITGSANLSSNSMTRLQEAGMLSEDVSVVAVAREYVVAQARRGIPIDIEFLRRISDLELGPVDPPLLNMLKESCRSGELFRLVTTPRASMLRPYFLAAIEVQLGGLYADVPFDLWPQFHTEHDKKDPPRLKRIGVRWQLTEHGVSYFAKGRNKRIDELIKDFSLAIATGDENDLPNDFDGNRTLVPWVF